jgi:hypothetical protein
MMVSYMARSLLEHPIGKPSSIAAATGFSQATVNKALRRRMNKQGANES